MAPTLSKDLHADDRGPVGLYLATLRQSRRLPMLKVLNTVAGMASNWQQDAYHFSWCALSNEQITELHDQMRFRYKQATVNKMMLAIRGVLLEGVHLGLISAEDYRLALSQPTAPPEPQHRGHALTQTEIAVLEHSCLLDETPAGVRDAAMFPLMYQYGLGSSQVVRLTLEDFCAEKANLRIHSERTQELYLMPLEPDYIAILENWLRLRGSEPGPLFYRVSRTGNIQPQPLNKSAMLEAMQRRAKAADLISFGYQDLRRTYLSRSGKHPQNENSGPLFSSGDSDGFEHSSVF